MFLFFKKKIKGKNRQIREWYWGVEQDKVFEILKIYLVLVLILGYVDSILLYELYIDVQVIFQEQFCIRSKMGLSELLVMLVVDLVKQRKIIFYIRESFQF